jgi:hypothetical protein
MEEASKQVAARTQSVNKNEPPCENIYGRRGKVVKHRKMRRVPPIAPEKDNNKVMKWLREHRAEYANQWVALDEDRLIKAGRSAKEVYAAANAAGLPHALIVLVEPPDTPPFAGF